MKYAVFATQDYEQLGGWDDLFGLFNDIEEAKRTVESHKSESYYDNFDEYHIVDLHLGEKVYGARRDHDYDDTVPSGIVYYDWEEVDLER